MTMNLLQDVIPSHYTKSVMTKERGFKLPTLHITVMY